MNVAGRKSLLALLEDVDNFLAMFGDSHKGNYSLNANNLQNICQFAIMQIIRIN